jgi:hypothetical protein
MRVFFVTVMLPLPGQFGLKMVSIFYRHVAPAGAKWMKVF